jgi:tetratricopeptide (TPR) repeat protein
MATTFEELLQLTTDEVARATLLNSHAWFIYENRWEEQYEQGIAYAREAVRLFPEYADLWDTLAWLNFVAGRNSEAVDAMKEAVRLEPESAHFKEALQEMEESACSD